MAKQVDKNHPVILLTIYLALMKRGDARKASVYRTKLARRGIHIEGVVCGK